MLETIRVGNRLDSLIGDEQVEGPVCTSRDIEIRLEPLRTMGLILIHREGDRPGTPDTHTTNEDEVLRKVKKTVKSKKKGSKKVSQNIKAALTEVEGSPTEEATTEVPPRTPTEMLQPVGTVITRLRVITARDLAQMTEEPSWLVQPDVYYTGLYKSELLTHMVSELMDWESEGEIMNWAFPNEVITMEPIDLQKGPKGAKRRQALLEDLRQEGVDAIRRRTHLTGHYLKTARGFVTTWT